MNAFSETLAPWLADYFLLSTFLLAAVLFAGWRIGQPAQRLAIARALLKNAPILILDEPTSALDARTESELMVAVEELMEGRTTFIIAHRLSTIRRAPRIVVLDKGRVAEMGTHTELMATCTPLCSSRLRAC